MKFNILPAGDFDVQAAASHTPEICKQLQDRAGEAVAMITKWPGYATTPLVSLPGLAAATNVAAI